MTKFSFVPASRRLKTLFAREKFEYQARKAVPSANTMTYKSGHYAECYVICVDIRDSSTLHHRYANDDVLVKIYQGFISELVRVMRACPYLAHVDIHGDAVTGIFHATRVGVSASVILQWAVRATEVVAILNDKLREIGLEPIRVGVGLSYGRVLMVKAGARGEDDVVWLGEPVNFASKLSSLANKKPEHGDGQFMATDDFYAVLNEEYQTWFAPHVSGHYTSIIDLQSAEYQTYLKEWPLLDKKASSPGASFLGAGKSTSSAVDFLSTPSALALLAPSLLHAPSAAPSVDSALARLADALSNPTPKPVSTGDWLSQLYKK